MKALSIRQPWAWLIVNGFKDIENRTWTCSQRGEILIHASAGMTRDEYEDVVDLLQYHEALSALGIQLPDRKLIERGGIVGTAVITGSTRASKSPWFNGPHGFILRDAKSLPFIPYKGMLGFFEVPDGVVVL